MEIAKEMSIMGIEFGVEDFTNFIAFLSSDMLKGVSEQIYNIDSRIM